MRYLISDSVAYEGSRFRFVYDTKFKHFAIVQKQRGRNVWVDIKYVDSNFYVLFPGHTRTRETDRLPNWK